MIETMFAQLRFAASITMGYRFSEKSLARLVKSLQETRHEFGALGRESAGFVNPPSLGFESSRELALQRFRNQATRASRTTAYYHHIFDTLGLNLAKLTYSDIATIPVTTKESLRNNPDGFVANTSRPFMRSLTTGTTGWPTSIYFSAHELQTYALLSAIAALLSGDITSEDIVQLSTSGRGTLGNLSLAGACAHIGAVSYLAGVVEPELTLAMLTEKRSLPHKKERTSVLYTYPSYLGELVEYGLQHGYGPQDFGLERVIVGGEIVSQGLRLRAQRLFGSIKFLEGYGNTEIWPVSGRLCNQSHLHFEPTQGLVEVLELETDQPAKPGSPGRLVVTPFFPYRETTLLLRYDTGDIVQVPDTGCSCDLEKLPVAGELLGKSGLSVQHNGGWIFPRQIIEALEVVEDVPLPARFSLHPLAGGVKLQVFTLRGGPHTRQKILQSLEEHGVRVSGLEIFGNVSDLHQPFPLRTDLREYSFNSQPVPELLVAR